MHDNPDASAAYERLSRRAADDLARLRRLLLDAQDALAAALTHVSQSRATLSHDLQRDLSMLGESVQTSEAGKLPATTAPGAAARPSSELKALTQREREVAILLARGLTNRQIAGAIDDKCGHSPRSRRAGLSGNVLKQTVSSLPVLGGLGTLGAAELLVEVGDPRRFPSADAFASDTGTGPIPASSAEVKGRPVHHRLSRFGNRRINAVPYIMAVTRLRYDSVTQDYVGRLLTAGKTKRDALRILKRRLVARLVWITMMRDLAPAA
jgi:transposase